MIKTRHLQLGSIKPIHVETLLRNKRDLGVMLRVTVPTSWPTFPEAFSLPINESREIEPQSIEWNGYLFRTGASYGQNDRGFA